MAAKKQLSIGRTGAKRQSWRHANPRAVLRDLLEANPLLSEKDAETRVWTIVQDDKMQLRTIFEYWFALNYRSLTTPPAPVTRLRSQPATQEMTSKIGAQLHQEIERRAQIALLDMIMPSGKSLRNSTREELLECGGWMRRIAEKLKPRQTVGQANMSETVLRKLIQQKAA